MTDFELGDAIYENPLAGAGDIDGWRTEGEAGISFPRSRMRMEALRNPDDGQAANFVHWCDETFPDDICIAWDFWPVYEPGLAILFFAATGKTGQDLFDPSLATRTGPYEQYHHGDINALHVSYFRRRFAEERAFHTCNLRKSYGFHLVAQGADPIPPVRDATPPYRIQILKVGPTVQFAINDLAVFAWHDDGQTYGPVLAGGKIGFRQMAPLIADYANLTVHRVSRK